MVLAFLSSVYYETLTLTDFKCAFSIYDTFSGATRGLSYRRVNLAERGH